MIVFITVGRCLKLWMGKGLYSWLCQSVDIYICFIWYAKNETWGIAELFHQVFCLKDRKISVVDHVWALFGTWISLLSWMLPSCWLFWGIALNVFYRCCSRLWTTGALGTRELILDCGVMEAWGNMRDFVCVAVRFSISAFSRLSGTALRDLSKSNFMKYAEVLCVIFFIWRLWTLPVLKEF